MQHHRHTMPFGTEIEPDGRVRFRLWAPGASRVELELTDRDVRLAMATEQEGWYGIITEFASVGEGYRFRIDGGLAVPDPAARQQVEDVHGPSVVVDPCARQWQDGDWQGRPWEEAVLYELHVGSFTPEGTFQAAKTRLDHLAALGVTAIELMPVADFPGRYNWGYDGVLPFAPDTRYGSPEDLKDLVEAAHAKGLMVFLDVVYNHFGPEGNYLHAYAEAFFTDRHHTPWGKAINFDGTSSHWVREFFIHNALFWLQEYRMDGLRLDAVHAIMDDSGPDILTELARHVAAGPRKHRHLHLVLENDRNEARYLDPQRMPAGAAYDAQWNDDLHHCLHVLTTGETDGYYQDYAQAPAALLGRCLAEGFAYQGEPSPYRRQARRGEPSAHLPPTAFVAFIQNHDQAGNRALGERITELAPPEAIRAATAICLLAPSPPLLFMGQEWGSQRRFPFFCDFEPGLAPQVAEGRRREFEGFEQFRDSAAREQIPDPGDVETFRQAVLDWQALETPGGEQWRRWHQDVLAVRHKEIVPRLGPAHAQPGHHAGLGGHGVQVSWQLGDGSGLHLVANLDSKPFDGAARPAGRPLFVSDKDLLPSLERGSLPAWAVGFFLDQQAGPT